MIYESKEDKLVMLFLVYKIKTFYLQHTHVIDSQDKAIAAKLVRSESVEDNTIHFPQKAS